MELKAAFDRVLQDQGPVALQYGPTEGYAPLRQWVAEDLRRTGAEVSADEVLIVSGSQQALDMLGKLYIDAGSPVLVEAPSYLGALQSFSLFEPRFVSTPTYDRGLIPADLHDECTADARNTEERRVGNEGGSMGDHRGGNGH